MIPFLYKHTWASEKWKRCLAWNIALPPLQKKGTSLSKADPKYEDHQSWRRKTPHAKRAKEKLGRTCISTHSGGLHETCSWISEGYMQLPLPPGRRGLAILPTDLGQLRTGGIHPCWCMPVPCQGKMEETQEQSANHGSRRKETCSMSLLLHYFCYFFNTKSPRTRCLCE